MQLAECLGMHILIHDRQLHIALSSIKHLQLTITLYISINDKYFETSFIFKLVE